MKIGKYTLIAAAAALLAVSAQAEVKWFVPASGDINVDADWYGVDSATATQPTSADDATFTNGDVGQGDQTVNVGVNHTVRAVYSDWTGGGNTNTVGGPGTLTIAGGYNWAPGVALRAGEAGGGRLNMTGNVVINNPGNVTDIRTQNGDANVVEFTPSSSLTLNSTTVTLQWDAGTIEFNGAIDGAANLMIQSSDVRFGAGHDSSAWTGNILMNGSNSNGGLPVKLSIDGGIVGTSGGSFIGNYGANEIELNGANAINGMNVSAYGALTLDLNAGQDDFGSINEIQSAGLTLDLLGLGAGEEVWFDASAGGAWNGALTVLGFQEDTLRFGTDASGLTAAQLGVISGDTYGLTSTGYLTVIPEPATIGLLFIGGLGLFVTRRARV